ncbi:NRDE protein-domain-containing protein [Mycena epipterygia]|nr:NRDE protein-domain-containing protein [Mycena epipterygia]
MCVAFWTLDHPDYALILCANRDEFLARPTLPAGFHSFGALSDDAHSLDPTSGRVLSGRDALAGGTWLGLAPASGRVALLTNITEPTPAQPLASRGDLVPAFLLAGDAPLTTEALGTLYPPEAKYAGFNLLVLSPEWGPPASGTPTPAPGAADAPRHLRFAHAARVSNAGARGRVAVRALRPDERAHGGMSNGKPDGDAWPKVVRGRALFAEAIGGVTEETQDAALTARLFALLRTPPDEPVRSRAELRRAICVDPLEVGAGPSATVRVYATRLATVLLVRRSGAAHFAERDVWALRAGAVCDVSEGGGERVWRGRIGEAVPVV